MLSLLHRNDTPYFIFTDSNINLLKLTNCVASQKYLEIIHSNGFLNCTFKATRVQGNSFSLIDQVLSKNEFSGTSHGVLINTISDHFFNFIAIDDPIKQTKSKWIESRDFSPSNMNNFRATLNSLGWGDVYGSNDANTAFNNFFETFNDLYQLYFPKIRKRINKNLMKINDFMTNGLLISRRTKNNLHINYLKNRTTENFNRFKCIVMYTIN